MATNRELRKALLKKLGGITPQALSLRAQKVKRDRGPMSTEDAVYVIAHDNDLDISKYLTADEVARIRSIRPAVSGSQAAAAPRATRPRRPRDVAVTIGKSLPIRDPVLPEQIIKEARQMAQQVYPKLYLLENSAREVIRRVMSGAFGKDWWNSAPAKVRANVEKRRAAEKNRPWHGKRGAHEIFYTDIDDLKTIVNGNWKLFEHIFQDFNWFSNLINVVSPSRNISSHHNPLHPDDIKRIDVYFSDWNKQMNAVKDNIP